MVKFYFGASLSYEINHPLKFVGFRSNLNCILVGQHSQFISFLLLFFIVIILWQIINLFCWGDTVWRLVVLFIVFEYNVEIFCIVFVFG